MSGKNQVTISVRYRIETTSGLVMESAQHVPRLELAAARMPRPGSGIMGASSSVQHGTLRNWLPSIDRGMGLTVTKD